MDIFVCTCMYVQYERCLLCIHLTCVSKIQNKTSDQIQTQVQSSAFSSRNFGKSLLWACPSEIAWTRSWQSENLRSSRAPMGPRWPTPRPSTPCCQSSYLRHCTCQPDLSSACLLRSWNSTFQHQGRGSRQRGQTVPFQFGFVLVQCTSV